MGVAESQQVPSPELRAMIEQAKKTSGFLGRGPSFWCGLFLGTVAVIAGLKFSGAIERPVGIILGVLAMGLMFPIIRSSERSDCANPVTIRYNRRMLLASFGYVLGLGIAISIWNTYEPTGPIVFGLAMLPTLPTFGMIWAMGRYLVEEQDEYLRYRTVLAALISLGGVLAIGIFWGFLETFGLVPHIWAWWVLPVWAFGLGIAQLWIRISGR